MTNNDVSNTSSQSTNWAWRKVKLSERPQGTRQRVAAAPPRSRQRRRQPRGRIQIVIAYVGGSQASYTVRCDGFTWKYPGWIALDDMMTHFNGVRP